jgi:hypothetical protein
MAGFRGSHAPRHVGLARAEQDLTDEEVHDLPHRRHGIERHAPRAVLPRDGTFGLAIERNGDFRTRQRPIQNWQRDFLLQ